MPFGRITATQNDTWTDTAKERLNEVGAPPGLANHVEVKTAMMAIQTGATDAEVTINHAPCGSEAGETGGCHAHLETILPPGCRLTVLGTDSQGRPYKRTYEGKQR
ncbi:DddA-like double-stranded DNA deaminase toxin [Amycolatopsis halotolerans]